MLARLRKGVQLEDGPANFKEIKFAGGVGMNQWYDVTLMEGRNRGGAPSVGITKAFK